MTDLQIAKRNLFGHTICLCRNGQCLFSEKRGIAPIMNLIADGVALKGYSIADLVVGKAAAMLFVRSGIKAVFARLMADSAKEYMEKNGIVCEYGKLVEKIFNREGTELCPMEEAVADTEDVEKAYYLLLDRIKLIGERI